MAKIPPAETPIIDKQSGKISLEWYAALQRLVTEIASFSSGGVSSFEGRAGAVVSAAGDYTASEITNVPAGNIGAVTVQAAIDELDAEKQPLDGTLTAWAAYNTNGLLTQTAADTFTGRTLTAPAAGITVSNGNGVAGNPTLALANDLAALEGMASTGLVARTAAETYAQRTVTGTANEISVSNGDGVAGNPTLSLPATIDLGGKTSLEIPNSAAPTVDADGEIAVDTTVADFSHGVVKYFSGEECAIVAMPIAQFSSPTDGYLVTYNGSNDEFVLAAAPAAGSAITADTVQATTSGTAFDFSFPASVRRITVIFDGISMSGTDDFLVQIGDSGGLETTGYVSTSYAGAAGTENLTTSTSGFVARFNSATRVCSGHMVITRITGNDWVASHTFGSDVGPVIVLGGGRKSLSADLDRLRLTRTGTNTFDLGQVNVLHEL